MDIIGLDVLTKSQTGRQTDRQVIVRYGNMKKRDYLLDLDYV